MTLSYIPGVPEVYYLMAKTGFLRWLTASLHADNRERKQVKKQEVGGEGE